MKFNCLHRVVLFLLFSFFVSDHLNAQLNLDTLNKYDESGEKQGFWIDYLTERLVPTKDTSRYFFYAFDYYDEGVKTGFFPLGSSSRKSALKIDYHGLLPKKGELRLLDGHITYYDKDSVSLDEFYENGIPVFRQSFFWTKNKACRYKQVLDYDHPYKNEVGSFYYEYFNYDDSLKKLTDKALLEKGSYRKKTKTWRLHDEQNTNNEASTSGGMRYNIEYLDRNGKRPSLLSGFKKKDNYSLVLGYAQSIIHDKWLSGAYIGVMSTVPHDRLAIAFSMEILSNNYRAFTSPNNGISASGSLFVLGGLNLEFHYFIYYKPQEKISVFHQIRLTQAQEFKNPNVGYINLGYYVSRLGLQGKKKIFQKVDCYGQIHFDLPYATIGKSPSPEPLIYFAGLGFTAGFYFR